MLNLLLHLFVLYTCTYMLLFRLFFLFLAKLYMKTALSRIGKRQENNVVNYHHNLVSP